MYHTPLSRLKHLLRTSAKEEGFQVLSMGLLHLCHCCKSGVAPFRYRTVRKVCVRKVHKVCVCTVHKVCVRMRVRERAYVRLVNEWGRKEK